MGGRVRAYAVSQTTVVYEETQSNRVSDYRNYVCSLFPKTNLFDFCYSSSG